MKNAEAARYDTVMKLRVCSLSPAMLSDTLHIFSLLRLQGTMRLLLTGTPVQNNCDELVALLR